MLDFSNFDPLAPKKRGRPASPKGAQPSRSGGQNTSVTATVARRATRSGAPLPQALVHHVVLQKCACCGEELHINMGLFLRFAGGKALSAWQKWTRIEVATPELQQFLLSSLKEELLFTHSEIAECTACLYIRMAANGEAFDASMDTDTACRQGQLFTPALPGQPTSVTSTLPYPQYDSAECH